MMFMCKGKRTKRPRMSSTGDVAVDNVDGDVGDSSFCSLFVHSPTSSCSQMSTVTDEDENMARCLVLLAKSGCSKQDSGHEVKVGATSCPRITEFTTITTTTTTDESKATNLCTYQCKTCGKKFPTFQALGGHRASHSKPKLMLEDHKRSTPLDHHQDQDANKGAQDKMHEKSNKRKKHECSICGLEFFTGQALGGHMRRHKPLHINKASMAIDDDHEKPKPIFALDLNLPAPNEDDEDNDEFNFSCKQQSSALSAPSLVDCQN